MQKMPKAAPLHPWEWPAKPWQRIHVDFAGPFLNTTFLAVVDAHSKWPEVFTMSSTTSGHTIQVLRELFSRTGVPEQLVSDNGPQFTSEEFRTFLKCNGIRHITSAQFHPSTNGLAERFVQSLKNALRAMADEHITLHQKLINFLFAYRNAVHSTTNQTPAMLFLGRSLRSRLDLLRPNLQRNVQEKQMKQCKDQGLTWELNMGETVLTRDYRGLRKWIPAKIKERTGPLSYTVEITPGVVWRCHIDQLRRSQAAVQEELPAVSTAPTATSASPSAGGNVTPAAANVTEEPTAASPAVLPHSQAQADAPCEERRYPTRVRNPPERLNL